MPIQDIGQSIVATYLAAKRLRLQQNALAQEKQLKQQQFEQDNQQFQERLKQQSEQFKLQQELRNAQFKNALFNSKLKGSEALAKGYLAPDETTEQSVSVDSGIPEIGLLSAPNPETQRKKKIEEEISKAVDLFQRQTPGAVDRANQIAQNQTTELTKRDEARLTKQLQNQKDLEEVKAANAIDLEKLRQKGRVGIAHIRGRYGLDKQTGQDGNDVAILLDDAKRGGTTLEELQKA